jgi:hypothetical protein
MSRAELAILKVRASSFLQVLHRLARGPANAKPSRSPVISVSICSKSQPAPFGARNPRNPLIFPFFPETNQFFNTSTLRTFNHPISNSKMLFRTIIRTITRTLNDPVKSPQTINLQPQACKNGKDGVPKFAHNSHNNITQVATPGKIGRKRGRTTCTSSTCWNSGQLRTFAASAPSPVGHDERGTGKPGAECLGF